MEKNLGHATAYGYAKSKGYSGTEEEFAELMADYASVGQSAAESAEQAAASATSASGSADTASQAAQTATSKASEAVTAADTANIKASEANQSANTASAAATSAITSAQTATAKAGTATAKADEAAASEAAALSAKTDAETARDAAAQSASEAAESARTLTIDATLTQSRQAADAKKTGDGITGLKSAFNVAMDGISIQGAEITGDIIAFDKTGKTITQIAISDTSATSATITRCGKNIYPKYSSGAGNGLSWVVASDGTITFTGTPSADTMLRMYNQNIPVREGEKVTFAFFNNMADSNNRLSFFGVNATENLQVNLNSTNKVHTYTYSISDVRITEFRFRIPKDIDWTGLVVKPMMVVGDVAGEFEEYNGQTYTVTVSDGVVQGGSITYLDGVNTVWSSVGDVTLTFDQAGNIKEYVDEQFANVSLFPSFYKYIQMTYSSGTQKYLHVYNKSGNKVVQWTLMNTPSTGSNSDTWQIGGVKGYDFDGNTLSNEVELALNGEFELAIKEHGAADYCGGINHGDEKTDVFKLFIDGKQISDLTTLDENFHAFNRIDAFEIATINRCNTPSENIITHQKIWTFEGGKVTVRQTIKFLEELSVDTALVCMFAALRGAFKYGIRKGGVAIEDMTTASYEKTYTRGNDAFYEMYGANVTAKIHASTDNSDDSSVLWINNTSDLNKLYYGYFGVTDSAHPVTVPQGTVITSMSEYDVAYTGD